MISDITLGQFFPGFSHIHKLDPRTKIILSAFFIAAVFVADTPVSFGVLVIALVAMTALSRISLGTIIKGVKPIIVILLITAVINVLMTKADSEPLVRFWIIEIYTEGIIRAAFMALRVIILIIGTSLLLTYTTSPISLTDGLESLLSPLKKIKVPVHTFAMMMSIALRFIPTLIEETEKIMNAQKSRGADFSSGGLIKRAKSLIPILLPLFVSSFNRAEELATAMECRCYRGDVGRTKLVKLEYRSRDVVAILLILLLLGGVIALRVFGSDIASLGSAFGIAFYKIR